MGKLLKFVTHVRYQLHSEHVIARMVKNHGVSSKNYAHTAKRRIKPSKPRTQVMRLRMRVKIFIKKERP